MHSWQENRFYGDFDRETLPGGKRPPEDHRSPFAIDRDRVVFSYAFRRLQSKTQVFQSGEFDFYRTRLTHSMEVARIGRSICDYLTYSSPVLQKDFFLDQDLTEGICLSHDLGHPPFGHIGERKLNELMSGFGGFEGNGQTLRILTRLIYAREKGSEGMNPTRAFLDGVLKYKQLYRERFRESGTHPENHFIYDDQEQVRDFALGSGLVPGELDSFPNLNKVRSIECQVMDWADDAAYSLNDIVDGIEARYITQHTVDKWAEKVDDLSESDFKLLDELKRSIREGYYERKFGSKVGAFINATRIVESEGPFSDRTNRYRFRLDIDPASRREANLYKRIANDLIFQSTTIQQIEFKGSRLLGDLFEAVMDNYSAKTTGRCLKLVSDHEHELFRNAGGDAERARLVSDFLSGLTDGQAVRYYKKWFDPDFASILDIN
ncbi:dGTP triphosphohydrolase [Puniceicoccus vermicola]|uniref:DNTP triphosphohydrolase n=1 Tax=Puniceicoccus vermicola TaxID=388746 RepID=A0A7X1AYB6_9BACT|nr:dNTP triphosphohydrolase [Puniceicoccus vermicola]MBC2602243.1 dNTP triphosphohydrolase [Puniceicoccus vermicola]